MALAADAVPDDRGRALDRDRLSPRDSLDARGGNFPPTRHSAIAAMRSGDESVRRRALETIVAAYWRPAYKYLRLRWRIPDADAQDAVQSFFVRSLEKEVLEHYEPGRAAFRTFLRRCLDNHLANQRRDATRQKRGGDQPALSLDFEGAESELSAQVADPALGPEELFHREWRRGLFALALERLKRDLESSGRGPWFRAFEKYDLVEPESRPTYAAIGGELGVPATTVTNWLHGARGRLRVAVLEQLRELTASDAEFRAEARALFGDEP